MFTEAARAHVYSSSVDEDRDDKLWKIWFYSSTDVMFSIETENTYFSYWQTCVKHGIICWSCWNCSCYLWTTDKLQQLPLFSSVYLFSIKISHHVAVIRLYVSSMAICFHKTVETILKI